MALRKRMNHVAAGLLGSFNGRDNDLDGFWAIGMLYEELRSAPYRVELDLLTPTATPVGSSAVLIAGRYADFLRHALVKKNLQAQDLLEATVTLQFKADSPGRYFPPHLIGDPYTCTVTLRSANDEAIYTAHGKCMPHDPRLFSRSARALRLSAGR